MTTMNTNITWNDDSSEIDSISDGNFKKVYDESELAEIRKILTVLKQIEKSCRVLKQHTSKTMQDVHHTLIKYIDNNDVCGTRIKILELNRRKSGRTTAIINDAISQLLTTGSAYVKDHTGLKSMAEHIVLTIERRFAFEHKHAGTIRYDIIHNNGCYFADIKLVQHKQ